MAILNEYEKEAVFKTFNDKNCDKTFRKSILEIF